MTTQGLSASPDSNPGVSFPREAHSLLPHGAPFSLVDWIMGTCEDGGFSRSIARADNPMLDADGVLAREAFPEYAAQTAAALDSLKRGAKALPGLLVEVSEAAFFGSAKAGSVIEAETHVEYELGQWRGIRFRVSADGSLVAEGLLKICVFG